MERSKIGFVVGLRAEAALLRRRGFMLGIGGGTPAGAALAARDLVAQGAAALVSFGLAGGLDPALAAGALVVPREVVAGDAVFACDPALLAWLGGATAGRLYAGADIAATVAQKSALLMAARAAAIDLESGAMAQVAQAAGVPFAVLRAVVDPAGCALPPAALLALNQAGTIGFGRVAGSVLRHPRQVRALLSLARGAARARQALRRRLDEI